MPIHLTNDTRRARLVYRHHLDRTAADAGEAVAGVLALHSSDPASPYLAAWARVRPPFTTGDLDDSLFEERSLWRLHAMRRTLFVIDTRDGPMFQAAVGETVAAREWARLHKWLSADMPADSIEPWLRGLIGEVEEVLADGAPRRTTELADVVPDLRRPIVVGSGKWAGRAPLSSRLLYLMAMDGRIVRGRPAGTWRSSQYHWVAANAWFTAAPGVVTPTAGRAELLTRYLASFGPATTTDIRWWTGWNAGDTRVALEEAGAVSVSLDDGEGWVLDGDFEAPPLEGRVVSFLPGLDSTPMGWKEREWYLAGHGAALFDRNGNVGPTIWLDGQIVGGWGQQPDRRVAYRILSEVDADAVRLITERAEELTAWLDGVAVTPRFRAPLERELSQ
ncbi:MAG: winged helix DNA-binding domain-containing protein [Acidimicrobiia bacterium]